MPTDSLRCAEVEARLVECLLARRAFSEVDHAHAAGCPACGTILQELRELAEALDGWSGREPPPELLATTWHQVSARLAEAPSAGFRSIQGELASLPVGFARECLRLLGGALLPLPFVVAWNLVVLALGQQLLGGLLPSSLLAALALGYGLAAAGWIALIYATIPFAAHWRALRRVREVPAWNP